MLTTFGCAGLNNTRVLNSVPHQLLPFNIDLLEAFCVFGKLASDILGSQEDRVESGPVFLDLNPDLNDRVNGLESLLPLAHIFFEFFDFFLCKHGHKIHRLGLNQLDDYIECTELVGVTLFNEGELEVVPGSGDDADFTLDLGLLLSSVNNFSDFVGKLVQVKLYQVLKTELG